MMAEDPAFAERVRENCRRLGKSGLGVAATPSGSEPRKRIAAKLSAHYLAWCPEQYREEYRQLKRRRTTAKARAIILAKVTPFEWQMHRLKQGAALIETPAFTRRHSDVTLGGVTSMEGI
jgi:hypothetical protein